MLYCILCYITQHTTYYTYYPTLLPFSTPTLTLTRHHPPNTTLLLQHPDDKNEAYLPKILVLLGFTLSQACILLLPLDVANKDGYAGCAGYDTSVCGGLDMQGFWEGVYIAILVFVVFLIPFAIFYYEADDGMGNANEVRKEKEKEKKRIR